MRQATNKTVLSYFLELQPLSVTSQSAHLGFFHPTSPRASPVFNTTMNYLLGRAHSSKSITSGSTSIEQTDLSLARRMSLWVGAMAGGFGSMVGVGGGGLISPIIANSCKSIPQCIISGTSLAAVIVTGATSGIVFHAHGEADFTSAAVVAVTAVMMAPLGAKATHLVDSQRLRMLMGYWLYFVALMVPLKTYLLARNSAPVIATQQQQQGTQAAGAAPSGIAASCTQNKTALAPVGVTEPVTSTSTRTQSTSSATLVTSAVEDTAPSDSTAGHRTGTGRGPLLRELRPSDAVLAATGVVAGFASGLFGVGGGTIVTPALALFAGMGQTQAVGTSLMAMVLPSIVALAQHARMGNVDWLMAAGLGAGTLIGSSLGSNMAVNAPPMLLEASFAVGIAYLGHKTLAAGLRNK